MTSLPGLALAPMTVTLDGRPVGTVRPWPGRPATAHLALRDASRLRLTDQTVLRWLAEFERAGYQAVRTNAVPPVVRRRLEPMGFHVVQNLVLLARTIAPMTSFGRSRRRIVSTTWPRPRTVRLDGWRSDPSTLDDLASLDAAAFGPDWRLDPNGLIDACRATPRHVVRVVSRDSSGDDDRAFAGYALTGRAGHHGYLQRLAVEPTMARRGVGALLVADALGWLARHDVRRVFVNTHHDNAAALALYRRAGFVVQDEGLVVLGRDLPVGEAHTPRDGTSHAG